MEWLAETLGVPVTLHPGEVQEVRQAAPAPAADVARPDPLHPVGADTTPAPDDPDPPSPPAGHPAADPGWDGYDTWTGSDGWDGVDSTGALAAELEPVPSAGPRMQVQPDVEPVAWRSAEPVPPGYPLRM